MQANGVYLQAVLVSNIVRQRLHVYGVSDQKDLDTPYPLYKVMVIIREQ